MEKHFGAWEGKAWDDIARDEIDAWAGDFMGYASQGGESAQQVMLRVQSLLSKIAQLPQRNIALVAHAGSIRAMLAVMGEVALADVLKWEVGYGAVIGVRG
jgi:alpha-ribazole phosphatase